MYVPDVNLTMPPDDTSLWRYQTFDRFVQFLDSSTLWFSRADHFSDQFEIAVPTKDLPAVREGMLETVRRWGAEEQVKIWLNRFGGIALEELEALPDDQFFALMPRFSRRFAYISSWHRNDTESAGLWAQYTAAGNGVAVRTTAGTLRELLDVGSGDYRFSLGEVHYLNYHTESWGPWHTNVAVYHKRRSFAYEQEVRALISFPTYDQLNDGSVDIANVPDVAGLAIPVDMTRLVQSVVISPSSQDWFAQLVSSVMHRYGLTGVPVMSELTEQPIW